MASGHGGARKGAGRKKGGANRITEESIERAKEASAVMPLDYMLAVMNDDDADSAMRLDAAKAAAPYIHPKLSAVELSGEVTFKHEHWLDELD